MEPRAPDPHTEAMEPVCLVEPVPSSGALRVNPAALGLLRGLTRPLHVLAVFGPRGTGKSFLMDRLAGQGEGFPCSPGIWVWCLPHPTQPDQALVLLDTEGFPEQEGDNTKLSQLFLLNVLLSSVLVYNTRSEGDPQRQLDRLTYVRDLPRVVQVLDECSWENSFLLSSVLPNFVWCLRDVAPDPCLDEVLKATGHELDSALSSPQDLEDSPSSCVQRLFPCRKLFRFCSPRADGGHGEPPSPADQLHPTFQEQMGRFKDYVLSQNPKTVVGNRVVDGAFLADFLERVVDLLSWDKPVLLSELCNDLQRERVVPLQASRPAPPVLAQATPGTAQPGAMEEPMCLIENWSGGELQLNQRALDLLQSFRQPVVVVAIAGLYRTGKSYLLNRLAGKDRGVLGTLAVTYVDAIRSGAVPWAALPTESVQELLELHAQCEREELRAFMARAFKDEEQQYQWQGEGAALPTESVQELLELHAQCEREELRAFMARAFKDEEQQYHVQELLELHAQCEREALRAFMARAFKDEEQQYQWQLKDKLDSKRSELCHRNELASSDRCTAALMELSQELEERAAEVLQQFLKSKEMVAQAVLQTDQSLTDRQREIEEERTRAEAAEREGQLCQEMQTRTEQLLKDQERSQQEHVQQLTAKMEEDRRQLLAEQQRALALKLQEQERLLREGFRGEVAQLEQQMQNLRKEGSRPQRSRCVVC
ncbi:Interferon-induced guanylate-binding protein 1 [Chelonia mydas]|uniref:Interferon-induced guanylate-binding protein 1 n=1 Tax=Chelonia mydas TaxID=8469 RepID=M7BE06_CHEMY|nr:Interferon-induced guanylate-binding protein 1 [Chelonia mydas]